MPFFTLPGRYLEEKIADVVKTEVKGKTCEDCEKIVLEILSDILEIDDVKIERAHRVKPYQNKKIIKQGLT